MKQNMEQSSISTNVHIDFQKKIQQQAPKRTYKPRTPQSNTPMPMPKKPEYPKAVAEFTPKQ